MGNKNTKNKNKVNLTKVNKNNTKNSINNEWDFDIYKYNKLYSFKIYKEYLIYIICENNYYAPLLNNLFGSVSKKRISFKDNNECFNYILNAFREKKVTIRDVIELESITLEIKGFEESFEITLGYKPKDNIIRYHRRTFIIKDSYITKYLDNTFTVFKSFNGIYCIIYQIKNNSMATYDLIHNRKINIIRNAHNNSITNFRHCFEELEKRDLIMSVSCEDNNIKIWNFYNWDCILNLDDFNKNGNIYSSCFLKENNQIYIVTSNCGVYTNGNPNNEPIKIFDLKGNKIKEINNSNDNTTFIDIYYDDKNKKKYILTGNRGYNKSYNYDENNIYNIYYDKKNYENYSLVINYRNDIVELINSGCHGYTHIWNFDTGNLIQIFDLGLSGAYGLCLWNNNLLYVGCNTIQIKIIKLNENSISDTSGHMNVTSTLKKITLPKYGQCLIEQGNDYSITIWK